MTTNLIIIGGGNMGGAIATRLAAAKRYTVYVVETDETRRAAFAKQGIAAHASLKDAPKGNVYILAIKPQQFGVFASELKQSLGAAAPLVLSIMAGITLADLKAVSPNAVRAMPNLPATIGESMSVFYADDLDETSRDEAKEIFAAIGAVAWVETEEQLHAVTAISGSGPAYVFALMEAMEQAAIKQGLPATLARALVTQTVRGAALLADAPGGDATSLRQQVTSKGGTTEAALNAFAAGGLNALVGKAADAAAARSKELAKK